MAVTSTSVAAGRPQCLAHPLTWISRPGQRAANSAASACTSASALAHPGRPAHAVTRSQGDPSSVPNPSRAASLSTPAASATCGSTTLRHGVTRAARPAARSATQVTCAAVAARLDLAAAPQSPAVRPAPGGPAARPVGVVGPGGTAAVLLAPLGRLSTGQLIWLADRVGGRPARITPWRSVVLPDLPDAGDVLRDAAGLGFGVDAGSPWLRVTACAGRPGCASALADVQADAAGFAARWPERIVHVSGCARHCGRPAATQVDVTATSEGYQVAGI